MGRSPRIQFENAVHHVYPRGNRRQRIAHTDQDYRILERYFIEAAQRSLVVPRAWHPMPNHFHAVLETPHGNLSEFMQRWLGRYARYYNHVYNKVGHLFQGRFGSKLVQKDAYLKELIRYVTLQVHRAKNPDAIDPFCKRYSSHRFYMGEPCSPEINRWIHPMLNLFSEDMAQARKKYTAYLADGLKNANWEDFYKPTRGIIGENSFIARVENPNQQKYRYEKLPIEKRERLLSKILTAACDIFGVSNSELCSAGGKYQLARIRKAVAFVGKQQGVTVADLSRAFRRGASAVSMMIRAVEDGKGSDEVKRLGVWVEREMTKIELLNSDTNDVGDVNVG